MSISAAGAGDNTIAIRANASSRERDMIETRITNIKNKYKKPIEDRAQLVLAASSAMNLSTAFDQNIVTSQIMTKMQQAIVSQAQDVNTGKEYARIIAENTDISIAAIKHRTAELVKHLQGKSQQVASSLYDMVWQGKASVVDFINSQVGHQSLEETILANEAIVTSVVNKYIGDSDKPYPQALEEILRMDVNDPRYIELVTAQQRAGELFYFSTWGKSAVTNMNIEVRSVVEDFNGQGMPILPRDNERQVNLDALATAHEYNASLVRPDTEDADATDKWVKFMLYLGLSKNPPNGVNGAKYYGIPANIRELEENLREGFVETMGQDLATLEQSWNFYTTGPKNTGESSIGYLSRINAIMIRLNEDGTSEINRVIDYVRSNSAQVGDMYPEFNWGYADAFMKANKDYETAKAATTASAESGELRALQDRAEALHKSISEVYEEYKASQAPPQEKASSTTDVVDKRTSKKAAALQEAKDARKEENMRKTTEENKAKRAQLVRSKRGMDDNVDEDDAPFGGARTKKRRPRRAAKKTRKGKRGKVGRMSRKTRKTTRGRKAKKAKKSRKTRRRARK